MVPIAVANKRHAELRMKFIPPLVTTMLLAASLLTGCQSPTTIVPSRSIAAQTELPATNSLITRRAPALTNAVSESRILKIDPSSMLVAGGKVTLIIGSLQRADGIYSGDYRIKVFPYFFENEKGRLAIVVSDESLVGINQGKVVAISGTATPSGKGGKSRHINATVTPIDINHGTLKLWCVAGNRKMIFEPTYHVAETGAAVVLAQTTAAKP
jgi:hypothetical protein